MVEGRTHIPVVWAEKCRTCGVCTHGCPGELIPEYRKEQESLRGALYGSMSGNEGQVTPGSALPPCRTACPVDLDTREYARLITEGRFLEALDSIREELPFPGIIGHICHHPCEYACLMNSIPPGSSASHEGASSSHRPLASSDRGSSASHEGGHSCLVTRSSRSVPATAAGTSPQSGEGLSLCALKKFLADYEAGQREVPVPAVGKAKDKKVAVVGGGPSGMACALFLRRTGYGVTIFESRPKLGGMLAWSIPTFRLPSDVLEREISVVESAGVEVRRNVTVGRDVSLAVIRKAFDAVYVACGTQRGARLDIEGEDAEGVLTGIDFLVRAREGKVTGVGNEVVVVGGGNVAIDAALTAKRLGARHVTLVCLEKKEEMPASKDEIEEAREEGIEIRTSRGPEALVVSQGRVTGIEIKKCLSVFDKDGRFHPIYKKLATALIDADMVLMAIGQVPETGFLEDLGIVMTDEGTVKTDPETLETTLSGVFAGGDATAGPRTAIDAIADGKKAAASIGRYLSQD